MEFELNLAALGTGRDLYRLDERTELGLCLDGDLRVGQFLLQAPDLIPIELGEVRMDRRQSCVNRRTFKRSLLGLECLQPFLGGWRDDAALNRLDDTGDPALHVGEPAISLVGGGASVGLQRSVNGRAEGQADPYAGGSRAP